MVNSVNYLLLDYDRPIESELCLKSIKKFSHFSYKIIYLSNGGNQDYAIDFYKQGLIDKLILRKDNSGCGLGVRELFNDFDLNTKYVILIQCDQFLCRDFSESELNQYIEMLEKNEYFYIDLAGNQGNGIYSERGQLINKYKYNLIPNSRGGPGKHANEVWTEKSVQDYMGQNNLKFFSSPLLIFDNGKMSRREYPCGGILIQETDTKTVYIIKSIKQRIDFPNIRFTDKEWKLILDNKWVNGTVPELHKNDSFKCWHKPFSIKDLNI